MDNIKSEIKDKSKNNLELIYKEALSPSQSTLLTDYLTQRLPNYTHQQILNLDFRYLQHLHLNKSNPDTSYWKNSPQTISDSILYPIRNSTSQLTMIGVRSLTTSQHKLRHNKITDQRTTPPLTYTLYNIHNILNPIGTQQTKHTQSNHNYIIITEGVFDALSLIPTFPNTISTLTASLPKTTLHLLSYFPNIILALDNDNIGIEQTKNIISFYNEYYPHINITTISPDIPDKHKDINETLIQSYLNNTDDFNNILQSIQQELDYFQG